MCGCVNHQIGFVFYTHIGLLELCVWVGNVHSFPDIHTIRIVTPQFEANCLLFTNEESPVIHLLSRTEVSGLPVF